MKFLKLAGIILLFLLIANSLTWYFIGKEKAIFLNLDHFDHVDNYPQVDTLYVTTGFNREAQSGPSRFIKKYDYSAFPNSLKNEFLEKLSQRSEAKKIIYREDFDLMNLQLPNLVYRTSINYKFPFVVNIVSINYELPSFGYSTYYNQDYIWLFNWMPVGSSDIKSR